jgi:anti-sigma regulatory factor (Ser/Thr protein kinase)
MPIEVHLPKQFDRMSMYRLLSEVVSDDRNPADSVVSFDFGTLQFIRPEGCVVLANLVEWLMRNDADCRFQCPSPEESKPVEYLDDSQFFADYLGESLSDSASPRRTTIPLQRVAYQESHGWLKSQLVPWLSNRLSMTEKSFSSIRACLGEIFNNIKDHAGEGVEVGCFFAQHYPREDRVQVAVSDFGVGIPANVRAVEESYLSDGQAIEQATEAGFTTESQPGNRGAGLNTLLHDVIEANGGELYIHSNRGMLSCAQDGSDDIQRISDEVPGVYPGTLISISFRTDTIENIPEEEFRW